MNTNNLRLKVGIFILFLLLNALGVIYYILDKKGTFDKRFKYNFVTYTAESLSVGMPIKVSGFTIGRVDNILLQDDGSVKVIFSVNKDNKKWLSKDSLLNIRKPLLGSSHIVLYSAIGNPLLAENSSLDTLISNDINDLVLRLEPIVNKIGNIVNSVDKITTYLTKDDSEIIKIVRNIEKFSSTLAKNESLLTSITGDKKATKAFIETINKLPILLKKIDNISLEVHKDIIPLVSDFLKQLGNITKDIEKKLNTLDSLVHSVGSYDKELLNIKEQINTGITKSNEIIEKVDNLFESSNNEKVLLP